MPEAADRPHLREVHVGVDEARAGRARSRRSTTSSSCAVLRTSSHAPARDDHAVADEQRRRRGRRAAATGERVVGRVEERPPEERHARGRRLGGGCAVRALPLEVQGRGDADGDGRRVLAGELRAGRWACVIRSTASASCPSSSRVRRKRLHFAADPMSPTEPRPGVRSAASQSAASSAWSWVITSTCGAGRQLGEHQLGQHGDGVHVHAGTGVGEHRQPARRSSCSAASRRGAGRGRAAPGSARARDRRDRRRTPRRTARRPAARAAASTSPPQHCTPCSYGARSDSATVQSSGAPPAVRQQLAGPRRPRPPRGCRRRRCPRSPVGGDDHLGAGLAAGRARAPPRPSRARRARAASAAPRRRAASPRGLRPATATARLLGARPERRRVGGRAAAARRRVPPVTTWSGARARVRARSSAQ